uniref:sialidase family protein n=1 Tax=Pseudopedobacter sp. TaxID=1936787 RepID=UPI003342237A
MKTKLTTLILLLAVKLGYTQVFQQDFSSSTVVSNYVNSSSPSANQFNAISNFANAPSTITSNALRFSKKGASSAYFVRTTPLSTAALDFMKFQFKIRVSEPATLNNYQNYDASLYIGDGTDVGFSDPAQVTAPVTASIHTRLNIKLSIASGSAKFLINGNEYSGEQTITLFINNTGDTIPKYYSAPNGYKSMVANDKFDVWVGNELVINEGNATTAGANINKFKFVFPSGAPNAIVDIDNIEIRDNVSEASQLWISTVKYQSPATQIYLGSPSIIKLSNGDLLASLDYFGPNRPKDSLGRSNRTSIYQSSDNGQTWQHLKDLDGMYWANLFEHKGDLYLLGTTSANGSIAIRKSTDNGLTWTTPASSSTGLLFNEGLSGAAPRYHGAPTPIAKAAGRLYRAFENVEDLTASGFRGYRAFVVSIDENDDLLDATKWAKSNELTFNGAWDPPGSASTTGWIEGNAIVGPDGKIWNMMRVNSTPFFDRSALLEITNNGQTISFNPSSDFISFPGGSCKFVVRKDTTTNIYWAMLNDNTNGVEPNQRNVLALYASSDLRNWYHAKTLMEDNQGFTLQQSI